MRIIPIYSSLVLPNTKVQFNRSDLDELGIEDMQTEEEVIFLVQRSADASENLTMKDIYPIGIAGKVNYIDEQGNVIIKAEHRIDITDVQMDEEYVEASNRDFEDDVNKEESEKKFQAIKRQLIDYLGKFQMAFWARRFINSLANWEDLAVRTAPYMNLTNEERYEILRVDKKSERIELITKAIQEFLKIAEVTQEANDEHTENYQKMYREDALKKQIAFLQKQLDNMHPENKSQIQVLQEKIEKSGMNEEARKEADKALNRLKQEGPDGHEYGSLYDYLDFVTSLKWKKNRIKNIDLKKAEKLLNEEHFGLEKVKKRVIEQMAVMKLSKKQSGSILLLVGPPGTGKTSIAHSIAKALDRKYVRISLGGVRDEAEIRGHRRTYIGAMPGRIMDGMSKAGTSNPVMVLDEIDKLSTSYNGDPASALLEVLDPEQNHTFTDHYLNVPYDLSDVLFICTANSMDTIPGPLRDRMEVISFTGYTPIEKFHIGKEHLLQKAEAKNGIAKKDFTVSDEAIQKIIENYTMEAGVRGLKKQLDKLCREAAVSFVKDEVQKVEVNAENLSDYIDSRPIHHDRIMETKNAGIVTGLAWTAVGGEILFIETMFTKGTGKLLITGQLGNVMKESAQIAVSLVKSMYPESVDLFAQNDLHIHVPAGATPKDGPSAGITLTTALASLVTGQPVSPEYAMTGEVSLRGNVMPIGGLPEKLLAAQRAGVKNVFIPEENVYDLKDVAAEVKEILHIIPVKKVSDVLDVVLDKKSKTKRKKTASKNKKEK